MTEERQPSGERELSSVLSEFARTMVTDFPIEAILDRLVERIVDILAISAAGVTLIEPDTVPRYVAASNKSALRYENFRPNSAKAPASWPTIPARPSRSPTCAPRPGFPSSHRGRWPPG